MASKVLLEAHGFALEEHFFLANQETLSNILQLLSDNWEHLNVDTIEFVEASPASLLGQSWEMSLHNEIVDLIRTIVHNAETCDSFRQIFRRLSLSCSCGSSRISTQLDMKGPCDCDPAPICERRDNQTRCGSHIFVSVVEGGLNLASHKRILVSFGGLLFLVVISQLLLPVEIVLILHVIFAEIFHNVSSMNVLGD